MSHPIAAPKPLVALALAAVLMGGALSGCTPAGVAVGAAASAGVVAAQERPVSAAIDDVATEVEINALYLEHSTTLFIDVSVDSVEGRVLLTGKVEKPDTRIDAARLAWQAGGVLEVMNEIEVTDQSGLLDYTRDVWISTQLRSELLLDKHVRSINYSVETVNGVVYLMGVAQHQSELERVVGHARDIAYVRRIVSYVRLKDAGAAPPAS
ncbi:MAG TPA: BON domain-containing protein [Alphaproteobacteria bacterium]|nr:BON domain-containing protein [Alphaproteobacteria bacterium]